MFENMDDIIILLILKTIIFICLVLGLISVIISIGCSILIEYNKFQIKRNHEVYKIKMKWLHENDSRYEKYKYDDMYKPGFKNIFGLKFPKEHDFK